MRTSRAEARRRRHSRVRKKVRGTQDRPRLAVFKSNRYISAQIIDDDAGRTLVAASSQEADLRQHPFNLETAGLVGKLLGERAAARGVTEVVFDRGGYPFHGRVKSLADSARQAGLKF